jgi:hypothetical protein
MHSPSIVGRSICHLARSCAGPSHSIRTTRGARAGAAAAFADAGRAIRIPADPEIAIRRIERQKRVSSRFVPKGAKASELGAKHISTQPRPVAISLTMQNSERKDVRHQIVRRGRTAVCLMADDTGDTTFDGRAARSERLSRSGPICPAFFQRLCNVIDLNNRWRAVRNWKVPIFDAEDIC